MTSSIGAGGDAGNGGNDNVIDFPRDAAERRALRRARLDAARQQLVNVFVSGDHALFVSPDGESFADLIDVNGHRQTWLIKSREFRAHYIRYLQQQLNRLVAEESVMAAVMKTSMKKRAVSEAVDDFELRAIATGNVRETHLRVAGYNDNEVFIDLCNADWSCVRVTGAGWTIVENPPIRFRRSRAMQPLPFPQRGGKIEMLRPFLNVTASDFILAVAYLLAALYPHGPYPVWFTFGEQGLAKTELIRKFRRLIDPHVVETTGLPFSARDLFVNANNTHFQGYENVSELSARMSDCLCRLSTGGGARTRKNFKDTEEVFFHGARPVAMEGIPNVVTRPDLQRRGIITEAERLPEYEALAKLNAEFELQRPKIFGALLDMMVRGLRMLPETEAPKKESMADFARWSIACGVENFEAAYAANRQAAINVMLSNDPLALAIRALMKKRTVWRGITTELLDLIGPSITIKSPAKLSNELRRLAAPLRTTGLHINHEQRTADERGLRIEWKK